MTVVTEKDQTPLSHALSYAARGWPVFPVHSIVTGRCTCNEYECSQPAKHPRNEGGLTNASTDEVTVRTWWRRWPSANVGIRTGGGLVVIDIDPRHGGNEGLEQAELENSPLPQTLEAATGGGGRHLFFACNEEVRNSVQAIAPGVDVRGDGGYVVAPPSTHTSGGTYAWANANDIAPLPQWILDKLKAHKERRGPLPPLPDKIIKGGRNQTLFKYAAKLRNQGFEFGEILAALLVMNAGRCSPPLPEVEIHTIANSASKYQPGQAPGQAQVGQPSGPDDLWRRGLVFDHNSKLKKTAGNAALFLTHHDEWSDKLVYDQFSGKYIWTDELPKLEGFVSPHQGEAQDHHYAYVQHWLLQHTATEFNEKTVCSAITLAARQRSFHPVRDYLTCLTWDRIPRVSRWLSTYLGVEDTPYTRRVGQWWLISAVARVLDPGCKVDSLLIFEGLTGRGKSKSVGILGAPWYSDTPIPLGDKDAYSNIQGRWIVELAELAALKGTGSSKAKAFFSSQCDRFRPSFEKSTRDFPRQCVFVGTTNENEYLIDPTGGRRYWPVKCGLIDIAALKRDRDMIWAEAIELYEREPRYWPETEEDVDLCKAEQDKRYVVDPWEELVAGYLINKEQVTVGDILTHLGVTRDKWDSNIQARVSTSLKRLQWEGKPEWHEGQTRRVYRRNTTEL